MVLLVGSVIYLKEEGDGRRANPRRHGIDYRYFINPPLPTLWASERRWHVYLIVSILRISMPRITSVLSSSGVAIAETYAAEVRKNAEA